ncbi:MAG: hypothetical protein ACKOWK_00950 [Micrococcales bacterium]
MKIPTVALWLSIVGLTVQMVPSGTQPAQALECRHRAASAPGLALGSQVDGNFVTICLSHRQVVTKTPPKSAGGQSPKTPIVKQPPVEPVARAHSRTHGVLRGADGSYTPVLAQPRAFPVTTKPGEWVTLASVQPERFGFDHLLGRQLSIRFTPVAQSWQLSDGSLVKSKARSWTWRHAFQREGKYLATLRVTYLVRFRIGLAAWQREPDTITLPAQPLEISVGQASAVRVVLVKNR